MNIPTYGITPPMSMISVPACSVSDTATSTEVCPSRNQAVVLDYIKGTPIRDYALAIGKIIGPSNMLSISRISQNRVCIYLTSKVKAESILDLHKSATVNGMSLDIRPLNPKTKGVLISNVHTSIPNKEIEKLLIQYGVTIKSDIIRLKSGLNDVGYTHLLSHRRLVYIDAADFNKIPQSCHLEYDNVSYGIYFSSNKPFCFLCKEEGHGSKNCRNTNEVEI